MEYSENIKSNADEATSVDSNLSKLISKGVAYHHAGLTNKFQMRTNLRTK